MKKILILAVMAMLAVSASAQKNFIPELVVDKVDADSRTLITNIANLRDGMTDRNPAQANLGVVILEDKVLYNLMIVLPSLQGFALPKGGFMLVKLNNGEIIELEQSLDEVKSKDYVGTYNRHTGMRTHNNRGSYLVDRADLEAIAEHGVAKIRIEKINENVDVEYKKERWQPVVAGWLGVIDEALAQKKDIYSDF